VADINLSRVFWADLLDFGSFGLPSTKYRINPRLGKKKITRSHAVADDGLRFLGTKNRAPMRIIHSVTSHIVPAEVKVLINNLFTVFD